MHAFPHTYRLARVLFCVQDMASIVIRVDDPPVPAGGGAAAGAIGGGGGASPHAGSASSSTGAGGGAVFTGRFAVTEFSKVRLMLDGQPACVASRSAVTSPLPRRHHRLSAWRCCVSSAGGPRPLLLAALHAARDGWRYAGHHGGRAAGCCRDAGASVEAVGEAVCWAASCRTACWRRCCRWPCRQGRRPQCRGRRQQRRRRWRAAGAAFHCAIGNVVRWRDCCREACCRSGD